MRTALASALILVGLGGCLPSETVPGTGGEPVQITQGTVATFHGLRLGVANIIKDDHVDEAGARQRELTAALTLFIDGDPPQERDFKVHAGQTVTIAGYSVYVEEIRATDKGLVTVRMRELSTDSPR